MAKQIVSVFGLDKFLESVDRDGRYHGMDMRVIIQFPRMGVQNGNHPEIPLIFCHCE